jgi:predicted transcriptional regulator
MMQDKDTWKPNRVMQAILGMKKLDIKELKAAYAGKKTSNELDSHPFSH